MGKSIFTIITLILLNKRTTSEKNIQVDNLPREFFHQKPAKREREHRQKEKHPKKRHKHHRHADRIANTANKRPDISNQIKEQELTLNEPPDTDRVEARETKITQEQPEQEHLLTHDEYERKKIRKIETGTQTECSVLQRKKHDGGTIICSLHHSTKAV